MKYMNNYHRPSSPHVLEPQQAAGRVGTVGMRRIGAQPDIRSSKTWADLLKKQEPYDTHTAT